jgi:hypothetical protein
VSEQPTAPAGGGGKRIFGLPRNVVIIGGVAFLAALGYILWKRSQANAAAVASNAASTTTPNNGSVDYAGELSVIQTELEALLAGQGQPTGTTTVTATSPPPAGSPVAVAVPDGNGGWMTYTFPSQKALNDFYAAIGVQGGSYPNGLTAQTIKGVLSSVGAQPGDVNNAPAPGPGTEAPPPVSVAGLPSYGPA